MILAYRSFFTPLILYQYFYTITVWLFFFINSYFFIPEYFFILCTLCCKYLLYLKHNFFLSFIKYFKFVIKNAFEVSYVKSSLGRHDHCRCFLRRIHRADSRNGLIASISMASTETIFYTMSVYYMTAKVTKTRYTLTGALLATFAGLVASVILAGAML